MEWIWNDLELVREQVGPELIQFSSRKGTQSVKHSLLGYLYICTLNMSSYIVAAFL